ncbi:hypothetical protein HY546_01500 [archaeon]|nr:hypothetical protein [archaeon]
MKRLVKARNLLTKSNPVVKKHFFVTSEFYKNSPDFLQAKERLKNVNSSHTTIIPPFGKVPSEITECFPFAQTVTGEERRVSATNNSIEKAGKMSEYWFGVNVLKPGDRVTVSRTRKMRHVFRDGALLIAFSASGMFPNLHSAAVDLHSLIKAPARRVIVDGEAEKFARNGKNVFAKFVKSCDPHLRPGDQVLVVNDKDELLASGDALLSGGEMLSFKRGPAIAVRWKAP